MKNPSGRQDSHAVLIASGEAQLAADLTIPEDPVGVVAFAHGSGSSRHSPRNRQVAGGLHRARLATLLLDLLTEDEERQDLATRQLRFDIDLLAERLKAAVDWLGQQPAVASLGLGCFGASTGAAAALITAATRPNRVRAVVSRGGRPDLADAYLRLVASPTLLIVGGADPLVIEVNRQALRQMRCPAQIKIVEGATHLFEEPGALERVVDLAAEWFVTHLTGGPRS